MNDTRSTFLSPQQLIDAEWIEAGYSREELDKEREVVELFDTLVATGSSPQALLEGWSGLTVDEILTRFAFRRLPPLLASAAGAEAGPDSELVSVNDPALLPATS